MRDREAAALAAAFFESLPEPVAVRLAETRAGGCGLFFGAALGQPAAVAAWRRLALPPAPGEQLLAVLLSPCGRALALTTRSLAGGEPRALDGLQGFPAPGDWSRYEAESRALFRELVEILAMQLPFRLPQSDS